jgi:DNA-binding transcriptional MerR regulator
MADSGDNHGDQGTGDPGPNGAPAGDAGTTPPPPPAPPTPPVGDDKQFSQADLDRFAGRRAAEAKKAAAKELADQLGMTLDEAKALIENHRQAEEAKKDELTRAQEAAAQAKADADAARAEAARLAREQMIDRKLVAAGVGSGHPAEAREGLLTRARAALQLAADADAEAIDAEIAATLALVPGLVAPPASNGQPPAPSGVTGGAQPPAGGQPGKSAIERGRERARAALRPHDDTPSDPFAGFRTA